jgi:hypothetical protein
MLNMLSLQAPRVRLSVGTHGLFCLSDSFVGPVCIRDAHPIGHAFPC